MASAGAAGFRCLSPDRVPAEVWAEIGAAARNEAPACRLLAWTPGLAPPQVAALAEAGFDGVFSSVGLWDCRAGWPADEYEALSAVGTVLAFAEAPLGDRLAQSLVTDEWVERRVERALWLAATLGNGVMVPMGLEFGAREPVPPTGAGPETYAALRGRPRLNLAERVRAVNAFVAREGNRFSRGGMRVITSGGAAATAVLRIDRGDVRQAEAARLVLVNPALDLGAGLSAGALSPEAGRFLPFRDVIGSSPHLEAEAVSTLGPPRFACSREACPLPSCRRSTRFGSPPSLRSRRHASSSRP